MKFLFWVKILFIGIVCSSASVMVAQSTADIEKIVHDYLVKNPEVLVEASKALQEKQMQQSKDQALEGAKKHNDALFRGANDIVVGDVNGDVTLVEFFDYNCGHCREMTDTLAQLMKANPHLRVVFKDFPIFGKESESAAAAAFSAYKQGKYLAFHDALLSSKRIADENAIMAAAKAAGIKMQSLKAGIKQNQNTFESILKNNRDLAQTLGVIATPEFFIAKTKATESSHIEFYPGSGSLELFQDMIKKVS
jgi:protein-disulfide isomerase